MSINYLKDNRIGIGISGTNISGTTASIFTENSHNLSGIVTFTISNAGTNYNAGVTTTLYNVPLYNNSATDIGDGATAHIAVGSGGTVASVKNCWFWFCIWYWRCIKKLVMVLVE